MPSDTTQQQKQKKVIRFDLGSDDDDGDSKEVEEEDDLSWHPKCEFDSTGEVDAIDYAKPLGKNNLRITLQELVCRAVASKETRQMQMELHMAVLQKDQPAVTLCIDNLVETGRARDFMAVMGLLYNGRQTGQIQDREYDAKFDKNVYDALQYATRVPHKELRPDTMLRNAISINDPLLLVTAIDVGADINDTTFPVTPLHNAIAREYTELIAVLRQYGAKE